MLSENVRDLLGKKKILSAEKGQEEILRARLELYFWTDIPTDPAIAAALLDGPGVPMASIIEHVTIRANLPVLKGGLVLQDLPGTGDVNARRRDAAQRYFEQADFIWVVAVMTRAVDDAGLRSKICICETNGSSADPDASQSYGKRRQKLRRNRCSVSWLDIALLDSRLIVTFKWVRRFS